MCLLHITYEKKLNFVAMMAFTAGRPTPIMQRISAAVMGVFSVVCFVGIVGTTWPKWFPNTESI